MRICKHENCENPVFGQGFCKFHYPRKPIKKITERGLEKKKAKIDYIEKQFELFGKFYDEHPIKKCEQCGINIYKCLSINVHHLLPKSIEKYKKVALESKYWMLLCGNCHSAWENSNIGDKIKIRTILAKEEFNKT